MFFNEVVYFMQESLATMKRRQISSRNGNKHGVGEKSEFKINDKIKNDKNCTKKLSMHNVRSKVTTEEDNVATYSLVSLVISQSVLTGLPPAF